jgi:hypothetical protein
MPVLSEAIALRDTVNLSKDAAAIPTNDNLAYELLDMVFSLGCL